LKTDIKNVTVATYWKTEIQKKSQVLIITVNAWKMRLNIVNSNLGLNTINTKLGCSSSVLWQHHGWVNMVVILKALWPVPVDLYSSQQEPASSIDLANKFINYDYFWVKVVLVQLPGEHRPSYVSEKLQLPYQTWWNLTKLEDLISPHWCTNQYISGSIRLG
jgi:hypothetical protein